MKYFSMFSGIGGFEYGIQRLCNQREEISRGRTEIGSEEGQSEQLLRPTDFEGLSCVGYSEVDKYAIEIYEKHFGSNVQSSEGIQQRGDNKYLPSPDGSKLSSESFCSYKEGIDGHKAFGNVETITWDDVPDFDLLVGGFPCQAFSVAGKRMGFDDCRGTMFFEIARCLRKKQPSVFLLENVKGLLSHNKGETFTTILTTLDELGYNVQWQVLNSKDFGVPQNRERVFIVGYLRGQSGREVFPMQRNDGEDHTLCESKAQTCPTITSTYYKNQSDAPYIVSNIYGGFNEDKPRIHKDNSPTIRTAKGGGHIPSVYKDARVRRLTPTECERLQGFPDGWTEGLSDTQRYKCLGNAVTTNVVTAIVDRMFPIVFDYDINQMKMEVDHA
jgi:DNA (cytosine-5)-methyltransferase 1